MADLKDTAVVDADEVESEAGEEDVLEFLRQDQEETEEAVDDGESEQPGDDAESEESESEEAATEPDAEIPSEKEATRKRFKQLTDKLRKYEKYDAIIEMLDQNPELSRRVVEKRMGLDESRTSASAPQGPTQEQVAAYRADLEQRMKTDPLGTLVSLIQGEVARQAAPSRNVGVRSLVTMYKSQRRTDEDLFKHYEPYFDAFLRAADPAQIEADPDTALAAIENVAFGTWAREQRVKAKSARKGKTSLGREKPRSLETSRAEPKVAAKPKRQLTQEEQELANIYGEDLVISDDDEYESVWGR